MLDEKQIEKEGKALVQITFNNNKFIIVKRGQNNTGTVVDSTAKEFNNWTVMNFCSLGKGRRPIFKKDNQEVTPESKVDDIQYLLD